MIQRVEALVHEPARRLSGLQDEQLKRAVVLDEHHVLRVELVLPVQAHVEPTAEDDLLSQLESVQLRVPWLRHDAQRAGACDEGGLLDVGPCRKASQRQQRDGADDDVRQRQGPFAAVVDQRSHVGRLSKSDAHQVGASESSEHGGRLRRA